MLYTIPTIANSMVTIITEYPLTVVPTQSFSSFQIQSTLSQAAQTIAPRKDPQFGPQNPDLAGFGP